MLSCCVLGQVNVFHASRAPRPVGNRTSEAQSEPCAAATRAPPSERAAAIAAAELILGTVEATRMACTGEPVTLTSRPSPVTFARSPLWKTWMPRFDCVHEMWCTPAMST